MASTAAVFIGGTFSRAWFARLFYRRVAQVLGDAPIIAIPNQGLMSIHDSASALLKHIDRLVGKQSFLVIGGHSQGALIAAEVALRRRRVRHVVCIGAPFRGTTAAVLGTPLLPSMRDMKPGSGYLRELEERLPCIGDRLSSFMFYRDRVVPWRSSYVKDAAANYLYGSSGELAAAWRDGYRVVGIKCDERLVLRAGHLLSVPWLHSDVRQRLESAWEQSRRPVWERAHHLHAVH